MGLGHVHWHHGYVRHSDLPVRTRSPGDFHRGNARTGGGAFRGREIMHLHRSHVYGVMGEFETPDQLIHAVAKVREAGYRRLDAYAPFPVEALSQALGPDHNLTPALSLLSALA